MDNEFPLTLAEELRDYPRFLSSIEELMASRLAPIEEEQNALLAEEEAAIEEVERRIPAFQEAVEEIDATMEAEQSTVLDATNEIEGLHDDLQEVSNELRDVLK